MFGRLKGSGGVARSSTAYSPSLAAVDTRYKYYDEDIALVDRALNWKSGYYTYNYGSILIDSATNRCVKDSAGRMIASMEVGTNWPEFATTYNTFFQNTFRDFYVACRDARLGAGYPLKVLFAFNVGQDHWHIGEVIISQSQDGDSFNISSVSYDPFGQVCKLPDRMNEMISDSFLMNNPLVSSDKVHFLSKVGGTAITRIQRDYTTCGVFTVNGKHNLKTNGEERIWLGIENALQIRRKDRQLITEYSDFVHQRIADVEEALRHNPEYEHLRRELRFYNSEITVISQFGKERDQAWGALLPNTLNENQAQILQEYILPSLRGISDIYTEEFRSLIIAIGEAADSDRRGFPKQAIDTVRKIMQKSKDTAGGGRSEVWRRLYGIFFRDNGDSIIENVFYLPIYEHFAPTLASSVVSSSRLGPESSIKLFEIKVIQCEKIEGPHPASDQTFFRPKGSSDFKSAFSISTSIFKGAAPNEERVSEFVSKKISGSLSEAGKILSDKKDDRKCIAACIIIVAMKCEGLSHLSDEELSQKMVQAYSCFGGTKPEINEDHLMKIRNFSADFQFFMAGGKIPVLTGNPLAKNPNVGMRLKRLPIGCVYDIMESVMTEGSKLFVDNMYEKITPLTPSMKKAETPSPFVSSARGGSRVNFSTPFHSQ